MRSEVLFIESVHAVDGGDDMVADARARRKAAFPGRSARRMTHLGMLVSLCLRELSADRGTAVVYASEFGESESLEKFIDSFPAASPALFQTSIHPSAVEQSLIPNKQAVGRFYPVTSDLHLAARALETCLLLGEAESILVGGEERGDWLCEGGFASERSFAFGLRLNREQGGLGRICLDAVREGEAFESLSLFDFQQSLRARRSISLPSTLRGRCIRIQWQ